MQDKITTIRTACIKANRDGMLIGSYCGKHKGMNTEICDLCKKTKFREARLADVLLALNSTGVVDFSIDKEGCMNYRHFKDGEDGNLAEAYWNLKQDDLTLQSPETIEFLYELLK